MEIIIPCNRKKTNQIYYYYLYLLIRVQKIIYKDMLSQKKNEICIYFKQRIAFF